VYLRYELLVRRLLSFRWYVALIVHAPITATYIILFIAAGVSLPIAVGVGVSAGVVGLAVIAAGVILGVKRLRTKVIPFRDREVNDPEQNSHRMAPMLPVGVQSETDQI
jgi:NAD/NADP transhydrogenase alpha subunit